MNEPKNEAVGTGPDPGVTKRRCKLRPVEVVALGILAVVVVLTVVFCVVTSSR